MIEKYGLYEDDIAEDEGYYESTKYKELIIDIDWGTGRLERYNDMIERIIGYEFDGQYKINLNIEKDEVDNYLECKNLKDIFHSLKKIMQQKQMQIKEKFMDNQIIINLPLIQ